MTGTQVLQNKIKAKYNLGEAFSVNKEESVAQADVLPQAQPHSNTPIPSVVEEPKHHAVSQAIHKPAHSRKMTLYVTEGLYEAFQKIYATRLLNGRATEKSALVCEAITLLLEKREKRRIYLIFLFASSLT